MMMTAPSQRRPSAPTERGSRSPLRATPLVTGVLGLVALTACSAPVERTGADAAPTGSVAPTASAPSTAASATTAPPPATGQPSEIRRTDWRNVTVEGLRFCGEADGVITFRNGTNGLDIPCRVLPDGAQPVYAEFIVEEPANRPATEDALVLVELGNPGAARRQALVPIQIGADGRTRRAWPVIRGDDPNPSGSQMMTFTSYRVENGTRVVATVKRLDGGTETRRYRRINSDGTWERF